MARKITPFADQIAARQYYKDGETYENMLERVAKHVARAEALDAYKADNGRYPEWYLSFEGRKKNLLDLEGLDAWIAQEGYSDVVTKWTAKFYSIMADQLFSPGGRILAGSATPYGQLMNCLSGDTLVHTLSGHTPIKDLHGPVTVLSQDGEWRVADFKAYGQQELWEVELINGQTIKATAEHLWLIPGMKGSTLRVTTKELLHENVLVQTAAVRPAKTEEYWNGVRHGMIYGDGTKNGEGYTYRIRSFETAERKLTRDVFAGHTIKEATYSGRDLTSANYRPHDDANLKELPEDSASDSYWYGFFSGFFAADGGIDKRGSAGIYQSNENALRTLAAKLPFLGIMPGTTRVFRTNSNLGEGYAPNYRLTLLKQTLIPEDFLREDQKAVFMASQQTSCRRPTLKVTSVRSLGITETVYCCEEPETNSFVVEGGILTSNCFVLGPNGRYISGAKDDHDSIDGIYELGYKLAKVTKTGGGCGISLSFMRESGSGVIGSGGMSSGPVSFLRETFNPTLRVIKLEGVRRGAGMATMKIKHPDVLDFITAKDKDREEVHGKIESFNISLLITDAFMEAVRLDQWHTFISYTNLPTSPSPVPGKYHLPGQQRTNVTGNPNDPMTSKVIPLGGTDDLQVKARWLWDEITNHAWQTGDPGVLFIDRINDYWPFREVLGELEATNPCGEEPLWFGESCCLGSLVLDRFIEDGKVQWDKLEDTTYTALRFLDNVITINVHPLEDTQEWCDRLRRVGLGVMGDAVAMMKLGHGYSSPEAMESRKEIARELSEVSVSASKALGKEKGYFPFSENLPEGIEPRRNVHMLSIAPTGTISMVCDTTSGIEPTFALTMQRRVGNDYKFRLDPTFDRYLRSHTDLDLDDETQFVPMEVPVAHDATGKAVLEKVMVPEVIREIMANHGSIAGLERFSQAEQTLFETAHDVSPKNHVLVQAAWQQGLDSDQMPMASISKTVNMPNSATVEDVQDCYDHGYSAGLKGITMYRDGSRDAQVLRTDMTVTKPEPSKSELPEEVVITSGPMIVHRPARTSGEMVKAVFRDANGRERKVYVYMGVDELGYPIEVFVTDEERGDVHPYATALGKMISMALKHGTPPQKLADKLRTIQGDSVSFSGGVFNSVPAMIGKLIQEKIDILSYDLDDLDDAPEEDPCAQGCNMIPQGGCDVCSNCGFSKCA